MLSSQQLEHLAGAATLLRGQLEAQILPPPASPPAMQAYLRLSEAERAVQADLTAASAHLASATALLHRLADRVQPVIEVLQI